MEKLWRVCPRISRFNLPEKSRRLGTMAHRPRGHIVADSLGGFGGRANLAPQNYEMNRQWYDNIEQWTKPCGSLYKEGEYIITLEYHDGSRPIRPTHWKFWLGAYHRRSPDWNYYDDARIANTFPSLSGDDDLLAFVKVGLRSYEGCGTGD